AIRENLKDVSLEPELFHQIMHMRLLGIDYGRKKMGLAISEGKLAEPWKVIKVNNFEEAVIKVLQVLQVLGVDKVIVGVSENKMAEESKEFAKRIGAETFDETLSTHEAQILSVQAGMKKKKRKNMEDAFAAAIILQNYLDSVV
ncbi:MAG: Holliday junction resolvase RuvX, partial [bacterium]|nr:Holliday junction resolvase RuvX [bacterium]